MRSRPFPEMRITGFHRVMCLLGACTSCCAFVHRAGAGAWPRAASRLPRGGEELPATARAARGHGQQPQPQRGRSIREAGQAHSRDAGESRWACATWFDLRLGVDLSSMESSDHACMHACMHWAGRRAMQCKASWLLLTAHCTQIACACCASACQRVVGLLSPLLLWSTHWLACVVSAGPLCIHSCCPACGHACLPAARAPGSGSMLQASFQQQQVQPAASRLETVTNSSALAPGAAASGGAVNDTTAQRGSGQPDAAPAAPAAGVAAAAWPGQGGAGAVPGKGRAMEAAFRPAGAESAGGGSSSSSIAAALGPSASSSSGAATAGAVAGDGRTLAAAFHTAAAQPSSTSGADAGHAAGRGAPALGGGSASLVPGQGRMLQAAFHATDAQSISGSVAPLPAPRAGAVAVAAGPASGAAAGGGSTGAVAGQGRMLQAAFHASSAGAASAPAVAPGSAGARTGSAGGPPGSYACMHGVA